jgi:hypothetical protein
MGWVETLGKRKGRSGIARPQKREGRSASRHGTPGCALFV